MTETPQENTAENYPAAESLPVRQRAIVATDRPARYIKQLGSHMGRKLGTAELPDGLRLTFNRDGIFRGYGDLREIDGALIMEVRAESDELAAGLADVLDRHLVRFGERDELVVTFEAVPCTSEGGAVFMPAACGGSRCWMRRAARIRRPLLN